MTIEPTDSNAATCACGPSEFNLLAWWRVGVGLLIAGNSMVLSLAVSSSEVSSSEWRAIQMALFALALVSLGLLGWPLAKNAARAAAERRLTIEAMFLSGIGGALVGSVIAATGGSRDSYFEVVPILLVVYLFGQQLTGQVQDRALQAAVEWAPELSQCLVLREEGGTVETPIEEIPVGCRVLVPPGEVVAADGLVESGEALVREAHMTGEPFVVVKRPGDEVWAGTHCVDAALTIRTTAAGRQRRIDRILDAVERARAQPSTLQAQADRLVARFLPIVMGIAFLTLCLWWVAEGWKTGLFNAMAVLLVACPCALGLATPLALWVAVARLASRGLTVANADSVEALASVDRVVFDKTGTLTEPKARIIDLVMDPPDGMPESHLAGLMAAVEGSSSHPIAAAFRNLAREAHRLNDSQGQSRWVVESLDVIPGAGVRAQVRGSEGNGPFEVAMGDADRLGVGGSPRWHSLCHRLGLQGEGRKVAVVLSGRPVAAALVDEQLRSSWPAALKTLRAMDLPALVLTGDSAGRAQRTRGDEIEAGLGPEQKLHRVQTLRGDGRRVLFVGDGVNDAAAMAASDVSIAVADGADLASEVADIVWQGTDLRVIPWALRLSRDSVATIRSNLVLAAAYNLVGIGLAVTGVLHPVAAALLMTCSSVVVTWRAIAGLQQDQQEAESRVAEKVHPGQVDRSRYREARA